MGVAHSLCNYVNTGQRWLYLGSSCSREPIQKVDNNGKMDNIDNSSSEMLSNQWTFHQRFSELAHF